MSYHTQPSMFHSTNRADEPVHKTPVTPAYGEDRYASEMSDIDIREAAGEFDDEPGVITHWNDKPFQWPSLRGQAVRRGIVAVIITEGEPEPEGAELILIRKQTQMCAQ